MNTQERALGRIQAWASHYKDESRSGIRETMKLIYKEAAAALAAREEPRSEANVIVTDEDGTHVQSREDTERPDYVDWDRVRRTLDEAVAAVAPPNVKEIKRIAAALRGWAESSEQRDGELTVEQAEFVVRMADDLYSAVCGEDTERPDGRAIEVAAKTRWEAACAHHRAGGKEHPTWDEIGTGDWAPYPKDLLLAWECVAVEAFLSVWGTEQERER